MIGDNTGPHRTNNPIFVTNITNIFQDDASSSGTDMSICRSEALFSSYKDVPGPGTSESLIQVLHILKIKR